MPNYDWMKTENEAPSWITAAKQMPRDPYAPPWQQVAEAGIKGLAGGEERRIGAIAQQKIQALMMVQAGLATWSPEAREMARTQGFGAVANNPNIMSLIIPIDKTTEISPSTQLAREKFEYEKGKPEISEKYKMMPRLEAQQRNLLTEQRDLSKQIMTLEGELSPKKWKTNEAWNLNKRLQKNRIELTNIKLQLEKLRGGKIQQRGYKIGDVIPKGSKKYKVMSVSNPYSPEDPYVEEI